MGFESEGGPPAELTDHVVAERYGCSPSEVREWPVDDYQLAIARITAENMAARSARLKQQH